MGRGFPLPEFPASDWGKEALAQMGVRPASSSDIPFLRELYRTLRLDELAAIPWTSDERQEFLDSQFDLQHRHYLAAFPRADFLLIQEGLAPAGRLYIDRNIDTWHILDISLLPSFRNRGIATALLTRLQSNASETRASRISLHVARDNSGGRRLYRRLGFIEDGESETHFRMRWRIEGSGGRADQL